MESEVKIFCPKCGLLKPKTEHHILPQRHFHGIGLTVNLCRDCHNEIEKIIFEAEKLDEQKYYEIVYDFLEIECEDEYEYY